MCFGFTHPHKTTLLLCFVMVSLCAVATAQFRSSKEWRTINTDVYEISVQKNGRTDLKTTSGIALFENAYPAVQYAGEDHIEELPISAIQSSRQEINDRLGVGQGLALRMAECEWQLRAYPAKPFLAVQVIYHNTTKKPIEIAQLLPWCVGDPKRGSVWLGADAGAVRLLAPGAPTSVGEGSATGAMSMAAFNPIAGRSLIAGFLSSRQARTEIHMARSDDAEADRFDQFRAACIYDPPVTVAPGERLESEVLYISVGEQDPLFGLRRYGKAVAVWNGVRDERPFTPHGITLTGADVNAERVLKEIALLGTGPAATGWDYLSLGPAWAKTDGSWEADPLRFPEGMKPIADAAHAQGLRIGLAIDLLPSEGAVVPEALAALARRITHDWGYDAIHAGSAATAAHPVWDDAQALGYQAGLAALRDGLGPDKLLVAGGPPERSGAWADVVRVDGAEVFSQTARSFYWTPSYLLAQPSLPVLGVAPGQQLSNLTAMALAGGVVHLDGSYSAFPSEARGVLDKLLPLADRPARPIDLFQATAPQIWHLPLATAAGRWEVLGLFNRDATGEKVITVDLRALGLDADTYHTVYDFWAQHYHGVARGQIEVRVPAGEHRLMGLRVYQNHPMLLASDAHFAMGAMDMGATAWNPAANLLSGTTGDFRAVARTLTVLVPEGYTPTAVGVDGVGLHWEVVGNTIRIVLPVGAARWQVGFTRG